MPRPFPEEPEPSDILERLPASFRDIPPELLAHTMMHLLADYYDAGHPDGL